MDNLFVPALAILGFFSIGSALGISAKWTSGHLKRRLDLSEARVDDLSNRLASLEGNEPPPATPDVADVVSTPPVDRTVPTPPPEDGPATVAAPPAPSIQPLEERLTSRWLVWIGGLALALAGAFLVKYSIEQEWLTPTLRCIQGFALGLALIAAGEVLRRRDARRSDTDPRRDYVPPALTAGGLSCAFASVYAAFALYGLIGPVVAFALLAAAAFGGFALAFLQGPLIAVLGLLGSFVTPLIVASDQASGWALFPYLFAVSAAAIAVNRFMRWTWLALGSLAGAMLWTWSWFARVWAPGDEIPVGLFMIAMALLYLFVRPHGHASDKPIGLPGGVAMTMPDLAAWAGGLATAIVGFALVRMAGYNDVSLALVTLLIVVYLVAAYRIAALEGFAAAAAALAVLLMATWHLPQIITENSYLYVVDGRRYGGPLNPIVIPEIAQFIGVSTAFAAAFGIAGFVSMWRGPRPLIWAGASAATPSVLFTIAYWRLTDFAVDPGWALVALGLAGTMLTAGTIVQSRWRRDQGASIVGVYAAATVSALGLGCGMLLEQAWLTVALAAQLPALAWIQARLGIETLRPVAVLVAVVVLVRLVLNPYVLDYPLGAPGLFNWILYGYGLPALMFFEAARRFRMTRDDRLVHLLDGGAVLFGVLLVSLEIRHLVVGGIDGGSYGLLEVSLQSLAWCAIGIVQLERYRALGHVVALYAARVLIGLAAVQVVVLQGFFDNPLVTGSPVAGPLFANVLFLAYAVPAAAAFWVAQARYSRLAPKLNLSIGLNAAGLAFAFVYLTLTVRHLYQGPILTLPGMSDAELYTYSVLILGFAVALLGLGYFMSNSSLRYASLVLIMASVAKVFLIDMADLVGLYRVLSFLGLGLALVGVGLFYRRFVFPNTPSEGGDPAAQIDPVPAAGS